MYKRGFTFIEVLIVIAMLGLAYTAYTSITGEKGVVMANINTLDSNATVDFDKQVTEYVENGMDGCLCCQATNDSIKVGATTISDDGSQISIEHECLNCGVEWMVQYAAFSIQASGDSSNPAGVLN